MRSDWPPGRARGFIFLARDFSLSFVLFLFYSNLNFVLLHANEEGKNFPFSSSLDLTLGQ